MYKRAFLNKSKGTAFIEAEASTFSYRGKGIPPTNFSGSLTMSDCNRQITLNFGFGVKGRNERIAKIDRLISMAQALRAEMVKAKLITTEQARKLQAEKVKNAKNKTRTSKQRRVAKK